ncbi:PIF1-like helicase domain-containing protein [Hirsutella rhossiliensis]|uniref:ATP-dependent DNA helicase n=1 Tax=Hirsutella rhossiliensis TaxID=111463 RepID=A0A9P8MTN7_9HYPO|nr:PIF1-like helicase domain-containing protein [Hirsutella rhossiliensis]KAH0959007.1 PIF1-like helicase domain-containing protein [Hirsutella rhossiliensis]
MLAHPHCDPVELRKINGVEYDSYASAAEFCFANHQHPDDYYGTPNAEDRRPDPDEFEEEFHEPDLLEEDWLELARQLPDCPPSQEMVDLLGRRDIDIQYDWTPHNPLYMDVEDLPSEARDTLNAEQRIVYDTIVGHFQCESEEQILLHVDGGGGTGKSYLIKKKLRDVRYLVIDEKSMLGLRQLSWIDKRLRQVFPARAAEFFGGISIILVGDFFQLPPIANKPLYFDGPLKDLHEVSGQIAYRAFNHTVFLQKVQRQQGDDQRVQAKLGQRDVDSFDAALRIYSKKARVSEYNYEHLVRLKRPAIQVMAKNIGNGADKATSEQAGNLAGQFPGQYMTSVGRLALIRTVVPILPVKRDFFLGASSITVDKMVTDLSERDFQTGLSYVAVSRVKTLEGLMIDTPFERASLHYEKLPDGK